jgi:transcriptional regulator with XRE-family HTH domain
MRHRVIFALSHMTPIQLDELRATPVPAVGNRLAIAFELAERSQADCVRETRFTAAYVSDMVRGRFQNITLDNAYEFARFFDCQIEDLFPARVVTPSSEVQA